MDKPAVKLAPSILAADFSRLGEQIADEISRITGTQNVAVVLKGEHYCMAARGIRSPAPMTSSVMRGVFRTERQTRTEFLRLIE